MELLLPPFPREAGTEPCSKHLLESIQPALQTLNSPCLKTSLCFPHPTDKEEGGTKGKWSYSRFSDLHVAPEPSTILELCPHSLLALGIPSHTHPPQLLAEAPISLHTCTDSALLSANFPNNRTTSGKCCLWDPELSEEPKLHHPAPCALPTCLREPPPNKNPRQTHPRGTF